MPNPERPQKPEKPNRRRGRPVAEPQGAPAAWPPERTLPEGHPATRRPLSHRSNGRGEQA